MPKTKQKQYHHGDLYEALVKAGTDLLKDQGLAGFTLRECARRAGVSHAAPKNHFDSVDALLAEIAARGYEAFVTALGRAADGAPSQAADHRLIAMGEAYVAFARKNPEIYLLMFRHAPDWPKSPHLQQAAGAAWSQLEQAVAAVIGSSGGDPKPRAVHVWALVHGIASLIIDRRLLPSIDPDLVIAQSLASLPAAIRGLGAA